MMQQILKNMYVEPELLAELSEEQRQLLFYKIRQEQVRRWVERETQEEIHRCNQGEVQGSGQEGHTGTESKRRNLQWLQGSDGEVWVWVMGEAPGDRPYEQIIRELMEDRARRQAQLEAQELRRKKEAELKQKFRDAVAKEKTRLIAGKWKEEAEDRKAAKQEEERIRVELEKREEEERQRGEEEVRCAEERRAKELYVSLEQERHATHHDNEEWEEQLLRSKAADEEMTRRARWARDEHHRQFVLGCRQQHSPHGGGTRSATTEPQVEAPPSTTPCPRPALRPAAPPLYRRRQSRKPSATVSQPLMDSPAWVRTPRPLSRESIVTWFWEDQKPKRAGYERHSDSIAPWFHGIITRDESERLLLNKTAGSFLVRVSEMIWGYTLSYRTTYGFKHFLIDAAGEFYNFLGVDQSCHGSLSDLIDFHKEEVITATGKELLQEACMKDTPPGDYGGLFP